MSKQLSKITLGICLSLGLWGAASAQTEMRLSISVAQNSHQGVAIDTFAKEVEQRTAGRYKIKTFYNGALGGERESIEAVQLGTQELAFSSSGPVPNFVPETKILDIPFLFRDKAHARGVLDGPIGQELLAKFDSKGFKALAWAENGFRHVTNNKRAVNSPEDLKGLKLRTMENPIHLAAWKALGCNPTPMAFGELFTAMQQGTVDGEENPLGIITGNSFQDVEKYCVLSEHVYSPYYVVMNLDVYNSMAPELQEALNKAMDEATWYQYEQSQKYEDEAVGVMEAAGMTVITLTPEQKAEFKTAVDGADCVSMAKELMANPNLADTMVAELEAAR